MPDITLSDAQIAALKRQLPEQIQTLQDRQDGKGLAVQPRLQRGARVDKEVLQSILFVLNQ